MLEKEKKIIGQSLLIKKERKKKQIWSETNFEDASGGVEWGGVGVGEGDTTTCF